MVVPHHEGEITYTPKGVFIHLLNALICIK